MSMTAWVSLIAIALLLALTGALLTQGPLWPRSYNVLWHLTRVFTRLWHGRRVRGSEHIPQSGPVIIASNHTTGLDPLLLQSGCRRPIRWVMLTSWRFAALEWLWRRVQPIFLDRGPSDVRGLRAVLRVLERGEVVGFFPEGGLQREHRQLNPFHPGFAMLAQRSEAMVVPAWVEGTPRRHSMLWQFFQPSRSRVTFGEPYRADPHASREAVLEDLRQRMEALRVASCE
jgi:1-acyl-sn-glycerol-3-phosphate acyltransferase